MLWKNGSSNWEKGRVPINSRSVPLAYEDIAQAKLDEMERKRIICKVDFTPEWISGMSGLPKGENDCRLVVNMKGPNMAIYKKNTTSVSHIRGDQGKVSKSEIIYKNWFERCLLPCQVNRKSSKNDCFYDAKGIDDVQATHHGIKCKPRDFPKDNGRKIRRSRKCDHIYWWHLDICKESKINGQNAEKSEGNHWKK